MLTDPRVLRATATAQEAGELLVRPEVVSVLVVDEEDRLVGHVTPAGLGQRVVAGVRHPGETKLVEIVEAVSLTVEPDLALDEAYRLMEEADVERLPVTEDGRLVGVLSRSGLQRRLAEDEPPPESEVDQQQV